MEPQVKFLHPSKIEAAACGLLSAYGKKYGVIEEPPIPVEEILEGG